MGFSCFNKSVLATMLSLLFSTFAWAQATNVQTLSEGACWYEQGENIKIVSFNDGESLSMNREELDSQIENLVNIDKKNKLQNDNLSLHCGGYGSSLVIKTVIESRPACLWVKFNKGKLSVRSFGGLEDSKSDLCDGYKWGELIVGVKSNEQKVLLESEHLHSMIESVKVISGSTLKINLHPEYYGKELFVMDELKKQMSLKYIELNFFQHPVGESASL